MVPSTEEVAAPPGRADRPGHRAGRAGAGGGRRLGSNPRRLPKTLREAPCRSLERNAALAALARSHQERLERVSRRLDRLARRSRARHRGGGGADRKPRTSWSDSWIRPAPSRNRPASSRSMLRSERESGERGTRVCHGRRRGPGSSRARPPPPRPRPATPVQVIAGRVSTARERLLRLGARAGFRPATRRRKRSRDCAWCRWKRTRSMPGPAERFPRGVRGAGADRRHRRSHRELATGTEDFAAAAEQIAASTEELNASTEEVTASAQHLANAAMSLTESTGSFRSWAASPGETGSSLRSAGQCGRRRPSARATKRQPIRPGKPQQHRPHDSTGEPGPLRVVDRHIHQRPDAPPARSHAPPVPTSLHLGIAIEPQPFDADRFGEAARRG